MSPPFEQKPVKLLRKRLDDAGVAAHFEWLAAEARAIEMRIKGLTAGYSDAATEPLDEVGRRLRRRILAVQIRFFQGEDWWCDTLMRAGDSFAWCACAGRPALTVATRARVAPVSGLLRTSSNGTSTPRAPSRRATASGPQNAWPVSRRISRRKFAGGDAAARRSSVRHPGSGPSSVVVRLRPHGTPEPATVQRPCAPQAHAERAAAPGSRTDGSSEALRSASSGAGARRRLNPHGVQACPGSSLNGAITGQLTEPGRAIRA
jgi:hypothetical protein